MADNDMDIQPVSGPQTEPTGANLHSPMLPPKPPPEPSANSFAGAMLAPKPPPPKPKPPPELSRANSDSAMSDSEPLSEADGDDLDEYFSSYEDLEVHRLMVFDKPRTEAYRTAIQENLHLFKDRVVMDVGAGTGILSLLAARAGARRVLAVEAAPRLAALLRRTAARCGLTDCVQVVAGRVEEVELNVKVDVIVSEWMGFYLLHESMLQSVIVARDRFLAEGGTMFPESAQLFACPSTLAAFHADRLQCWAEPWGLDMTAVAEAARASMQRQPQLVQTHPEELLAAPELLHELPLRWLDADELRALRWRRFVTVTRAGPYRGLCLWFRCVFPGGAVLDTSPLAPSTHWQQTAVVLPRDYELSEQEVVGFELALTQDERRPRQYRIALSMLGEDDEHPVPCGCARGRCRLIRTLMEQEDAQLAKEDEDCAAAGC